MEPIAEIDKLIAGCPAKEACHVLAGVREKLMAGEWGDAIRLLKQGVGPCGELVRECSPGTTALAVGLVHDEKERIRALWEKAFGGKGMQIDFICRNPDKLEALAEAMKMSDVVPLSYKMEEGRGAGQVRFTVEI